MENGKNVEKQKTKINRSLVNNGTAIINNPRKSCFRNCSSRLDNLVLGQVTLMLLRLLLQMLMAMAVQEIVTGGYYNDGTRWIAQLMFGIAATLVCGERSSLVLGQQTLNVTSVAVGNVDA